MAMPSSIRRMSCALTEGVAIRTSRRGGALSLCSAAAADALASCSCALAWAFVGWRRTIAGRAPVTCSGHVRRSRAARLRERRDLVLELLPPPREREQGAHALHVRAEAVEVGVGRGEARPTRERL